MRHSKRSKPEVNAGSMADIAFLLLIFFLVTATVPKDHGFNRKLPEICKDPPCMVETNKRNIMQILLNHKNQIMINTELVSMTEVVAKVEEFIDNNGDGSCDYCHGKQLENASDNPKSAVVSLQTSPNASYDTFIVLQDELTKAYKNLRTRYAKDILKKPIENLNKEDMKKVKEAYPFILSEALTKE